MIEYMVMADLGAGEGVQFCGAGPLEFCERHVDRLAAMGVVGARIERAPPRPEPCPTCGNIYDHRFPCVQ